ncbi:polysaccharide biosynthesis tyrosine autokinase [Arenimonas sp. GDDSR-1]|uniref:GumC family protein n=1 Tax=Arenimonas sp. GDDSR-1 TaxID=2950125 RepID=UPI002622AD82|nr:polysaccharide biosynthesis tyrosine autokinase [Arenimonas sp. GDDSR-1]
MTQNSDPSDSPSGNALPIRRDSTGGELAAYAPGVLSTDVLNADQDEFNIDLMGLWHILMKRRWTIAATVGIVFVFALVASLMITPVYRATASVQIDRELMNITNNDANPMAGFINDPNYLNTQYQLLQSRELASRVLSDIGFQNQKRFESVFQPSAASQIKSWFGAGAPPGKTDPAAEKAKALRRVDAFKSGYTIEPVRNTRLVKIHYNSTDPGFAILSANSLAEAFQSRNLETRFETSSYAKSYLEDQLKQLKIKLEDSEAQLVRFAAKEQIVSSGDEADGTLPEQNLGALNAALAKAKEERIRAQSQWSQAQSSVGMVTFGATGGNSIVRSLMESRSKLMADYQNKLSQFKPGYPAMLQLKAQIDETDKQIAAEIAAIKSAIRAEYEAAQQNENMIVAQIGSLKGEALDLKSRSIQYNIFKREVDTNRQLYEATLQRYKEIGVAAGVGLNNILIVDKAVSANKYRPNIPLNLAVALLLGLVLGLLLVLLLEYMDDTLKNSEDVEKRLSLAVLGVIPKLKAGQTLEAVTADVRSAFAEAYRSVRTALQFATATGVPRSLLITSASPSEGKTTAAVTIARNFSQIGKRVLLIDSDMRKPSMHKKMGIDNEIGLSNYLAGAATLETIIRETDYPGLRVVTTGPLPPNPAELLHDDNMRRLLAHGLQHFDQIIIDGPPVMGLADAPILSSGVEGVLLVIEAGVTRKVIAANAVKRLLSARARLVGVLINKFEAKHAAYGYGYGYGADYGAYNYYSYGGNTPKKLTR